MTLAAPPCRAATRAPETSISASFPARVTETDLRACNESENASATRHAAARCRDAKTGSTARTPRFEPAVALSAAQPPLAARRASARCCASLEARGRGLAASRRPYRRERVPSHAPTPRARTRAPPAVARRPAEPRIPRSWRRPALPSFDLRCSERSVRRRAAWLPLLEGRRGWPLLRWPRD